MTRRRLGFALLVGALALATTTPLSWQQWFSYWPDGDNIVMDDVFLPADIWSAPAQYQMSEYNEIDVTDNSHPFRINISPQYSFGADDGDNTIGFLGAAGLSSEYGLTYTNALAWTVCWTNFWTGRMDECDVMLDPTRPWQTVPDDNYFFQSTVLHELGHVRGLDHYNRWQSMQNSGFNKKLRDEVLYMDDKEGMRYHNSYVSEYDLAAYRKWHTGLGSADGSPQWMTCDPTTLREGERVNFRHVTVDNRGTNAFGVVDMGFYMSTNDTITTGDTFLNSVSWPSFGRFTYSTFTHAAVVPTVNDCGIRYFGGIIDHDNRWAERFEGNNAVAFSNGTPDPLGFVVNLRRDLYEANDTFDTARTISPPVAISDLSLDTDSDNDYYKFTLSGARTVDVLLSFTHRLGDIDVQLRNSSNVVIAGSYGVGDSEHINIDVAAGTYYILVYGFGGGACNKYTMTVNAARPVVAIAATDPYAGETGPNTAQFTVTRTGNTSSPMTVYLSYGGTASNGSDYTALLSDYVIPALSASISLTVTPVNDTLPEDTETVVATVRASSQYTVGAPGSATATIADNDPPTVSVTTTDASAAEIGPDPGTVTLTRNGPTTIPLSVNMTFTGTAINGTDYTLLSSPVVIPAGSSSRAVIVMPINDVLIEPSEMAVLTAVAGVGYVLGSRVVGTVSIMSDDGVLDLIVSSIKGPAATAPGATVTYIDKTTNIGSTPTPPSSTQHFLSLDKTLGAGDIALNSRPVPELLPGASHSGSLTFNMPDWPPRTIYLLAKADSPNSILESNEANNVKSKTILLGPDLTAKIVAAPATAAPGSTIALSVQIKNGGGQPTAGFQTALYLSLNSKVDALDNLLLVFPVGGLPPGATFTWSGNVTLPNVPLGPRYLLAFADSGGLIAEAKETNNVGKKAITLQ